MAAILDAMAKAGLATEVQTTITPRQIKQQFNQSTTNYPQANDTPRNRDRDAEGQLAGDASTEDTEETVYTDATLLDRHVRELLQSAGVKYDFRRAVENGTARKIVINDDLTDAMERLEAVAPLLNKLAEHAQRRGSMQSPLAKVLIKAGGSARGSASGSQSGGRGTGSGSGDDSGDTSTSGRRRTRNPDRYEHSSRGAASGSASGDGSGSASGSESGEVSKVALARAFMAGSREAGIELLRRKMRQPA